MIQDHIQSNQRDIKHFYSIMEAKTQWNNVLRILQGILFQPGLLTTGKISIVIIKSIYFLISTFLLVEYSERKLDYC